MNETKRLETASQVESATTTPPPVYKSDMSFEFRLFLQLVYSLSRQYCSWYDLNIKKESK